ncbi:hypothetical protein FOA52_004865 [Chlamydomonas sp. UWO 241]|nr:hypothetical protein FOA52_004865 [Chlamydomonas sp. UWO 241]
MAFDDDVRIQLKRSFADFLERDFAMPDDPAWNYGKGLTALYSDAGDKTATLLSRRLMVHEHHLREFDERLLQRLLVAPGECLPAFEDALRDFAKNDSTMAKLLHDRDELHIGLQGDFGRHEVSPRELTSERINQLVAVFGIVTKCSLVRPKVVKSVHYCETTRAFTSREYRDVSALSGLPTGAQYPTKDDSGNLLTTEYGLSVYKDSQMVTIQELPETAPPGQMPHSAEIILEDDLVDKVKPGDRVAILGVYKAVSGSKVKQFHGGVFRATVVGISAQKLTRENTIKHTYEEIRTIQELSKRSDILQLLANSLCPSIFGHDIIKRGLMLQMFGGLEKNLKNGTHLRGDINCLLVGDPGVAKSQLLRACMNIAPHSVSTTGRGASGVGLTAAVTHDSETGEKRLEAGAMVLADRGLVCIDEFDKMSDQDRVAIHEVMEQQTVTIAKAGIHCSLNARCSVLAAANPLYGSYDKSVSVMRNVNLPDSLLSRFDMLFVVLDQMNDARDRQVAMHVIRQHRYRPPGEDGRGAPVQETIHDRALQDDGNGTTEVFMRRDARVHGAGGDVLTTDFLRKYIIHARRRYAKLDASSDARIDIEDNALNAIIDYYGDLRAKSFHDRALPVTARTLECILRIATAMCKIRLSFVISTHDVKVATEILDHVMKKDVGGGEDEEYEENEEPEEEAAAMDEDVEEGDNAGAPSNKSARKRARRSGAPPPETAPSSPGGDGAGPSNGAGAMEVEPASARTKRQRRVLMGFPETAAEPLEVGASLTDAQTKAIDGVMQEIRASMDGEVPITHLAEQVLAAGLAVPEATLEAYLQVLHEQAPLGRPTVMLMGDGTFAFL